MNHSSLPANALFEGVRTVALVENGAINNYLLIAPLVKEYDRCIAVDGGLVHCEAMGILPDLIIGDFDSVPPGLTANYPHTPMQVYPTEKDKTDLELALAAFNDQAVEKIGIFAAMEKRTDHALANLHLLRRYPNKAVIETERETLFAIAGKTTIHCHPGQTLSLIPVGSPAIGVTTRGLQWELKGASIDNNFMSISNICLGSDVEIIIEKGDLICCLVR